MAAGHVAGGSVVRNGTVRGVPGVEEGSGCFAIANQGGGLEEEQGWRQEGGGGRCSVCGGDGGGGGDRLRDSGADGCAIVDLDSGNICFDSREVAGNREKSDAVQRQHLGQDGGGRAEQDGRGAAGGGCGVVDDCFEGEEKDETRSDEYCCADEDDGDDFSVSYALHYPNEFADPALEKEDLTVGEHVDPSLFVAEPCCGVEGLEIQDRATGR